MVALKRHLGGRKVIGAINEVGKGKSGLSAIERVHIGIRQVGRAIFDLKRGNPVIISGNETYMVASAERVTSSLIEQLSEMSGIQPTLVLSASRAAGILRRPVDPTFDAVAVEMPKSSAASGRRCRTPRSRFAILPVTATIGLRR